MNKNIFYMLSVFLVLCLVPLVHAGKVCTSATGSETDSTDFLGVNTSIDNTITMNDTQLFNSLTFFTPRLNFTKNVSEVFTAGVSGTNNTLRWHNIYNFSDTLLLLNSTGSTINTGNYTLLNSSADVWYINWKDSTYSTKSVTVYFMKNFTKNVDDIITGTTSIYTGATVGSFLTQNTPTSYGESKTFRFKAGDLGAYINVTDWAVGWSITDRTCESCSSAETGMFTAFRVVLIIIALMILMAGFYLFSKGIIPVEGLVAFIVGTIVFYVCIPMIRTMLLAYGC